MSQGNTAVPAQAQEQEEEEACPIGEVLDHIAGKWSIGIIAAAAAGPVRFTELERAIAGISRRMLTASWNATACSSGPCTDRATQGRIPPHPHRPRARRVIRNPHCVGGTTPPRHRRSPHRLRPPARRPSERTGRRQRRGHRACGLRHGRAQPASDSVTRNRPFDSHASSGPARWRSTARRSISGLRPAASGSLAAAESSGPTESRSSSC